MTAQKGKDLLIKIGDGTSPENFTTVAGLRATSLAFNAQGVDVTNADSARLRSCGMSTTTGPGRPVRAIWNASWIERGISSGSWIMKLCFTTGIEMPIMSASWKPSVPSSSVRT